MHRITYTKKELESLLSILQNNLLTNEVFNLNIEETYNTFMWYCNDFDYFYKEAKDILSQFQFEILFHIPLKTALLSVAHKDLLTKLIVQWRVQIQK